MMLESTPWTGGTIYYLSEWVVRIAMLLFVPLRRSPSATRSWLLLIFFLPIPGLFLYLVIGRPRFPVWRTDRFRALTPFFNEVRRGLAVHRAPPNPTRDTIVGLAEALGGQPSVGGNGVEYLQDYDSVYTRLIDDIDRAQHHVRILAYIFAADAVGERVADALARAVARGVVCHVLFDPVGSHRWRRDTKRRLDAAGVQVRATLPFHLLRGRTRRDMRNHRKLFLVDGNIGYAGSQNIVAKDFRPGITNRELVVRVTGPVVGGMTSVFLADWFLETGQLLDEQPAIPPSSGTRVAQVLPSGANYADEGFQTLLIWAINDARDQAVIATPYFIPDESLVEAMKTAVLRGVRVFIVVSATADQRLVSLAQHSYYQELLTAGIRILLYPEFLLHAKNVVIDDTLAIVGSSNVDIRSFQLNEEVSLLFTDRESVDGLIAVQRDYRARSREVSLETWRRRPYRQLFAENIARMLSPLL